jgi:hypothetical protein
LEKLALNGFGFIPCIHQKEELKKMHVPFFQLTKSYVLFQKIKSGEEK